MPVRTPPRPGLPVGLRDQRGTTAVIARYIRELSTRESDRRRERRLHRDASGAVAQRG
jgi:hypothetical protein